MQPEGKSQRRHILIKRKKSKWSILKKQWLVERLNSSLPKLNNHLLNLNIIHFFFGTRIQLF